MSCYTDKSELLSCHFFSEHEHLIVLAPVFFHSFRDGRAVLILVPELDDMEAAAVHVEVDVALLEIRGDGFPDASP